LLQQFHVDNANIVSIANFAGYPLAREGGRVMTTLKTALRLATVKEACAYAKMGRSKLYEKMNAGDVIAFRRRQNADLSRQSMPWCPRSETVEA
jgi:hypothetical protein